MLDLSDLLRDWASKRKEVFDKEATLTDNLETMSAFHYLKRVDKILTTSFKHWNWTYASTVEKVLLDEEKQSLTQHSVLYCF